MKKHIKRTGPSAGETIGIDLGDKVSCYCVLDLSGEVIEEGRVRNQEAALARQFGELPRTRIALETGGQSGWISQLLEAMGHEVIVANAREVQAITHSTRKNDRSDACKLARLARVDPDLLSPVKHRDAAQQADLGTIRARDALVRARTLLVNAARGLAKSHGHRLPQTLTATFGERARAGLPPILQLALGGILRQIDILTQQILRYEEIIRKIAAERYPATALLESVPGVGLLTALTFVLTVADPNRFKHSRDVGCYFGLRPKQRQSGEKDPQLGIEKAGDGYMRKLLVQCSHHILGRFGKDSALRQWGLSLAGRGGTRVKKGAIVAVARKLAVLLHRLWSKGEEFRPFPGNELIA